KKRRFVAISGMPTPRNPDASGAPPPFDSEATKFSAANALRLSLLANAAYLNQPDAKRVVNDLGLPQFEWIDLTEQFRDLWICRRVRRLCGVSISRHGQSEGLDDKPECRAGPVFMVF